MKAINELLYYREILASRQDSLYRWVDTHTEDGIIILGYPVYSRTLLRFINAVYDSGLLLGEYEEVIAEYEAPDIDLLIAGADMRLARALLTYYVRGEHYNPGLWGRGVYKRCFLRILDRLEELSHMHTHAKVQPRQRQYAHNRAVNVRKEPSKNLRKTG